MMPILVSLSTLFSSICNESNVGNTCATLFLAFVTVILAFSAGNKDSSKKVMKLIKIYKRIGAKNDLRFPEV